MKETKNFYEAVGCIHIHSVYSDGSGTIPDISRQAGEVNLDFLMMTDHHNLRALQNGEEGWYGKVLTIIGYEINDVNDANHYLAFNLSEEIKRNIPASEYVRLVKLKGGFGIIAHPDESRDRMPEHPPYPWIAWESKDFQGIEIWNQMSEWMEGLTPWNKLWRFVNPRRSILAPNSATIKRWDEINLERAVFGIGGIDAHAHKHKLLFGLLQVTVFRYKVQFKSIRTHLLLSRPIHPSMEVAEAKNLIFGALLEGNIFVSNYFNGEARGFRCYARNRNGIAEIGGKIPYAANTKMVVQLPLKTQVRVIRNGRTIRVWDENVSEIPVDAPGIYRLEILRRNRAWIYTNHIRIPDEES